ncbi:hypothetical protein OAS14_00910 [Alphaproteobacteria bacterium]|nr:hypothetical protein [Alphaproteobacteria bacterium]
MRPRIFQSLVFIVLLSNYGTQAALAGGKTYEGSESSAHCTLWSTDRLKWPQTILGREKAECRRKAVDSTAGKTTCRLIKTYIDDDSGERICIYKRQGTGLEELSLSMSAFLHCQKDFECKRTAK